MQRRNENVLKPWPREMWRLPGGISADHVCILEDVRNLFHKAYDPRHPAVCMDETTKQLIAEIKAPISLAPSRPGRYEHQYKRQGAANHFLLLKPLTGDCQVQVTERHTEKDWALFIPDLVGHFPAAGTLTVVMENLSTHKKSAL